MRRRQRAEMRLAELTDDEAAMRAGTVPIRRSALRPGGVNGLIPDDDQHPSIVEATRERNAAAREMQAIDAHIAALCGGRWTGLRRLEDYLCQLSPGPTAEHDSARRAAKTAHF